MNKLILVLILLFSLTACKQDVKDDNNTTNGDNKTRTTYAAMLVDTGKHGIENFILEKSITRSNVSPATKIAYNHSKPISIDKMSQIVGDEGFKVLDGSQPVKCTLK